MESKVAEIKARVQTIDLVEAETGPAKGPDGQGRYLTRCPFHEDDTPSFRVMSDGGYLCFACGVSGGDVIDYVAAKRGLSNAEAIAALGSGAVNPPARRDPPARAPKPAPWPKPVQIPIPVDVEARLRASGTIALFSPDPSRTKPEIVRPAAIYAYRREPGGPASMLVLRIERDGGKKVFRPATWDGERMWGVALQEPRPLYGLDQVGIGAQVLVVEGEKAADAARARLPEAIAVVTWAGGASSHATADWSPLVGRRAVVWPDADAPGLKAAEAILGRLAALGCSLKVVDVEGLEDGFDAADLPASEDMLAWIKGRAREWHPEVEATIEQPPELDEEPPPPGDEYAPPADPVRADALAIREEDFPFWILGQCGNRAYFLKRIDGRIVEHGLTSLTKREVLGTLAAPDVWQRAFGGIDNDGRPIGWPTIGMAAQAHIVAACERRPSFDPERVRGRGCWPHRGGVAFSRGDWVDVDGQRQAGNLVDGIIYESLSPLPLNVDSQLSDEEGSQLYELIQQLSWADGHSGGVLAGWIGIAPICGALSWRPHVWITGPSGSGKSTIMDEIVYPAVGRGYAIRVAGNTSEAGLRQAIGRDALPVLLDEAEPDAKGMRGILDLARSASTGDTVVRGTPSGGAQYFHIRSAFCFSAINPAIAKVADESRITRLTLKKRTDPGADAHFRRVRDEISRLITPEFGARLASRSIALARTTLANIRTMEDAIAKRFGSRRLAQQYGALIAGAWSLESRDLIDTAAADRLAQSVPDEGAKAYTEDDDAHAMISHLAAYQVEAPAKHGKVKVTIAELIDRLTQPIVENSEILRADATEVLARWGIRVLDRKTVAIAVNHPTLRIHLFKDTTWQHSYTARLRDLPGTEAGGQYRFAGTRCSTTKLSTDHILGVGNDGE